MTYHTGAPALRQIAVPVSSSPLVAALRALDPAEVTDAGVTAGDALATMEVPSAPRGCARLDGIVYGSAGRGGRELTLDLYRPALDGRVRPGVVIVHGGGFVDGLPAMVARYAADLAAHGYIAAVIRYRLAGEAIWPAPVEDVKCALRWMRAAAPLTGLDVDRLAVAGASAGGYLAALAAGTPGRFEGSGGHGDQSSAVAALALWYPLLDCAEPLPDMAVEPFRALFGGAAGWRARPDGVSPAAHLVPAFAPTLTMTGSLDTLTPSIVRFHRRLTMLGVVNRLEIVDGGRHSFDYTPATSAWSKSVLRSFLDSVLRRQPGPGDGAVG